MTKHHSNLNRIISIISLAAFLLTSCLPAYALEPASKLRQVNVVQAQDEAGDIAKAMGVNSATEAKSIGTGINEEELDPARKNAIIYGFIDQAISSIIDKIGSDRELMAGIEDFDAFSTEITELLKTGFIYIANDPKLIVGQSEPLLAGTFTAVNGQKIIVLHRLAVETAQPEDLAFLLATEFVKNYGLSSAYRTKLAERIAGPDAWEHRDALSDIVVRRASLRIKITELDGNVSQQKRALAASVKTAHWFRTSKRFFNDLLKEASSKLKESALRHSRMTPDENRYISHCKDYFLDDEDVASLARIRISDLKSKAEEIAARVSGDFMPTRHVHRYDVGEYGAQLIMVNILGQVRASRVQDYKSVKARMNSQQSALQGLESREKTEEVHEDMMIRNARYFKAQRRRLVKMGAMVAVGATTGAAVVVEGLNYLEKLGAEGKREIAAKASIDSDILLINLQEQQAALEKQKLEAYRQQLKFIFEQNGLDERVAGKMRYLFSKGGHDGYQVLKALTAVPTEDDIIAMVADKGGFDVEVFKDVCRRFNLNPFIAIGIMCQETNHMDADNTTSSRKSGLGDGKGLMGLMDEGGVEIWKSQFEDQARESAYDAHDPTQNVQVGCAEIAAKIQDIRSRCPKLPDEEVVRFALACYNGGPAYTYNALGLMSGMTETPIGADEAHFPEFSYTFEQSVGAYADERNHLSSGKVPFDRIIVNYARIVPKYAQALNIICGKEDWKSVATATNAVGETAARADGDSKDVTAEVRGSVIVKPNIRGMEEELAIAGSAEFDIGLVHILQGQEIIDQYRGYNIILQEGLGTLGVEQIKAMDIISEFAKGLGFSEDQWLIGGKPRYRNANKHLAVAVREILSNQYHWDLNALAGLPLTKFQSLIAYRGVVEESGRVGIEILYRDIKPSVVTDWKMDMKVAVLAEGATTSGDDNRGWGLTGGVHRGMVIEENGNGMLDIQATELSVSKRLVFYPKDVESAEPLDIPGTRIHAIAWHNTASATGAEVADDIEGIVADSGLAENHPLRSMFVEKIKKLRITDVSYSDMVSMLSAVKVLHAGLHAISKQKGNLGLAARIEQAAGKLEKLKIELSNTLAGVDLQEPGRKLFASYDSRQLAAIRKPFDDQNLVLCGNVQHVLINKGYDRDIAGRVAEAMVIVPRYLFLPAEKIGDAAYGTDLEIDRVDRKIVSSPYVVAETIARLLTDLKNPEEANVLVLDNDAGWQAAVLSSLVKKVYAVVKIPIKAEEIAANMRRLDIKNVQPVVGDVNSADFNLPQPVKGIIVSSFSPMPGMDNFSGHLLNCTVKGTIVVAPLRKDIIDEPMPISAVPDLTMVIGTKVSAGESVEVFQFWKYVGLTAVARADGNPVDPDLEEILAQLNPDGIDVGLIRAVQVFIQGLGGSLFMAYPSKMREMMCGPMLFSGPKKDLVDNNTFSFINSQHSEQDFYARLQRLALLNRQYENKIFGIDILQKESPEAPANAMYYIRVRHGGENLISPLLEYIDSQVSTGSAIGGSAGSRLMQSIAGLGETAAASNAEKVSKPSGSASFVDKTVPAAFSDYMRFQSEVAAVVDVNNTGAQSRVAKAAEFLKSRGFTEKNILPVILDITPEFIDELNSGNLEAIMEFTALVQREVSKAAAGRQVRLLVNNFEVGPSASDNLKTTGMVVAGPQDLNEDGWRSIAEAV